MQLTAETASRTTLTLTSLMALPLVRVGGASCLLISAGLVSEPSIQEGKIAAGGPGQGVCLVWLMVVPPKRPALFRWGRGPIL
jgi:hypothetical protein